MASAHSIPFRIRISSVLSLHLLEAQIVGKPGKVVKKESRFCLDFSTSGCGARGRVGPSATPPLAIVYFLLTPQDHRRKLPATFSVNVFRDRKKSRVIPEGGKACSICRDGPCSASIRSARRAATGCGPPTPEGSSAAIAALRSTMFRLRWARAFGCVPVRWEVTVHRAAHRDDNANRPKRPSGPLVPATPGRAVPASSTGIRAVVEFEYTTSACGFRDLSGRKSRQVRGECLCYET